MTLEINDKEALKMVENFRNADSITKRIMLITNDVIKQMSDLNKLDSNDDTNVESNLNVNA